MSSAKGAGAPFVKMVQPPMTETPDPEAGESDPAGEAGLAGGGLAKSEKEIQALIDSGKKQEAIDKAIKDYGIDVSNTKGVTYDPTVSGEAETSSDGTVRVGDDAFASPGWLGSSLAHETEVHVNKQAEKGNWYLGAQGTALQEVEAYDHEIANAKKFGLTDTEIKELEKRRSSHYDELEPDYKKRADKGIYTMKTGEEKR